MSKIDLTLCHEQVRSLLLYSCHSPLGKYKRKPILPIGLKQSSDWVQASLEDTLDHDLLCECVEGRIDDVGVFSNE